jgi:hypothetical protein
MKIAVTVSGPSEKIKGLFVAKGIASGKECIVLVKKVGNRAALVTHSAEPSYIGNGMVISFSGNTIANGDVAAGKELVFDDVQANIRPSAAKAESLEERVTRLESQNKELTGMVESLTSMLEAKATPAEPASPEAPKEEPSKPK